MSKEKASLMTTIVIIDHYKRKIVLFNRSWSSRNALSYDTNVIIFLFDTRTANDYNNDE